MIDSPTLTDQIAHSIKMRDYYRDFYEFEPDAEKKAWADKYQAYFQDKLDELRDVIGMEN